jgi:hypothetical protein
VTVGSKRCPFIDDTIVEDEFNRRIEYPHSGGVYVFWDHVAPTGEVSRVQFCRLIGRKRDVFECFNESEWSACPYYRSAIAARPPQEGK